MDGDRRVPEWRGAGNLAVRLLMSRCARGISQWRVTHPRRSFWRLYWNRTIGASVTWRGREFALEPNQLVIIAPWTGFKPSLNGVVDHGFVHLAIAPEADQPRDRILAKPLSRAEQDMAAVIFQRHAGGMPMGQLWQLLAWLAEAFASTGDEVWPAPQSSHRLSFICSQIDENPGWSWRNPELAARAGLSTNAFIRLFTQLLGRSPQAYVRERRLSEACILLEHSELSLEQIADECGFANRSHFATAFKHGIGTPPAAWRREVRQPHLL